MKRIDVNGLTTNRLLDVLGLAPKTSRSATIIKTVGLVSLGALVGAGLSLLFAPSEGRELRGALGKRIKNGADQVSQLVRERSSESASSSHV